MANKFICVEVSDRLVKVVVCLGNEKNRKVKNAFFYETPDETVNDGGIIDAELFTVALKGKLELHDCGDAKEIYFSVASSKVATREVSMPVVTDPKINSVVENNKTDYFPLELENYTVLYRVLSRNKDKKKGEIKSNVLVIAMPNAILVECAKVASGLKMRLRGVDALCSCMADSAITLKEKKVTAFVNVECTNTNIVFMRGTEYVLQRSLDYGGDDMIEAYRAAVNTDISYSEALEELSNLSAEENIRGKLTEEDVRDLLSAVVGAIARGVSFHDNSKEGEVQQIVLMGTCGNLLGLEVTLEEATGVATMQLAMVSTAAQLMSISKTPGYFLAGMYAGKFGMNFAKDLDPKKNKGKRAKGSMELDLPTAILIFILATVFAVYWAYSAQLQHSQMEEELARLDKEILDMEYLDELAHVHTMYYDSREALLNFTKMTKNPNEDLLEFLAELEAKMPSEILLLSAACTGTSVTMNIVVGSIVEAATVVSQLRSFESIGVIQSSGLGLSTVANELVSSQEFEEVSFSVVCTYGTNPYTSGLHPYSNDLGILNAPTT